MAKCVVSESRTLTEKPELVKRFLTTLLAGWQQTLGQRKNEENPVKLCYNGSMKKYLLSQTNPYLRDKAKRLSGLIVSVCSSSAIEGIAANTLIKEYLLKKGDHPTLGKSVANEQ